MNDLQTSPVRMAVFTSGVRGYWMLRYLMDFKFVGGDSNSRLMLPPLCQPQHLDFSPGARLLLIFNLT